VPATKSAISLPYDFAGSDSGVEFLATVHPLGIKGATEHVVNRDHLIERLNQLRTILPVFAQELESSRRQAAALRVENRGLIDEVRRLRVRRGESFCSGGSRSTEG
jgi:hypothetical protein